MKKTIKKVTSAFMKEKKALIFLFFLTLTLLLIDVFNHFYIINLTKSMPTGIYKKIDIKDKNHIRRGSEVIFDYENCCKIHDPSLPPVKYFLKVVTGIPGDKLIYTNPYHLRLINKSGKKIAEFDLIKESKSGYILPKIKDGEIPSGYYFMSAPTKRSFDSRYYGLVKADYILSGAKLEVPLDINIH